MTDKELMDWADKLTCKEHANYLAALVKTGINKGRITYKTWMLVWLLATEQE